MKNLIFVFILFATLLTVNADPYQFVIRTTQFNACPLGTFPRLFPKIDVTINPDPLVPGRNAVFDVSGTLKNDITAGTTFLGVRFEDLGKSPIGNPYSQTFNKSYNANTQFSIEAKDVPVPSDLPSDYIIGVAVGEYTNDPKYPVDFYGCAHAHGHRLMI